MSAVIAGVTVDGATLVVLMVALCAALVTAAVYLAVAGRGRTDRRGGSPVDVTVVAVVWPLGRCLLSVPRFKGWSAPSPSLGFAVSCFSL